MSTQDLSNLPVASPIFDYANHKYPSISFIDSFLPILTGYDSEKLKELIPRLFTLAMIALEEAKEKNWGNFDGPVGGNACQGPAIFICHITRDPGLYEKIEEAISQFKAKFTNLNTQKSKINETENIRQILYGFINSFISNKNKQIPAANSSTNPREAYSQTTKMRQETKEVIENDRKKNSGTREQVISSFEIPIPFPLVYLIYNHILSVTCEISTYQDEKGNYFSQRRLNAEKLEKNTSIFSLNPSPSVSPSASPSPLASPAASPVPSSQPASRKKDKATSIVTAKSNSNLSLTEIAKKLIEHAQTWINRETNLFIQHSFTVIRFSPNSTFSGNVFPPSSSSDNVLSEHALSNNSLSSSMLPASSSSDSLISDRNFSDYSALEMLLKMGKDVKHRHELPFYALTRVVFQFAQHVKLPILLKVRPLSKEAILEFLYVRHFIVGSENKYLAAPEGYEPNAGVIVIEAYSELTPESLGKGTEIDELLEKAGGIIRFIELAAAKHPQLTPEGPKKSFTSSTKKKNNSSTLVEEEKKGLDLVEFLQSHSNFEQLINKYVPFVEEAVQSGICLESAKKLCVIRHVYCDYVGQKSLV